MLVKEAIKQLQKCYPDFELVTMIYQNGQYVNVEIIQIDPLTEEQLEVEYQVEGRKGIALASIE